MESPLTIILRKKIFYLVDFSNLWGLKEFHLLCIRFQSSDTESGHFSRAHSVQVADYSDSGGEASTTLQINDRDTTSKTSSSEHVMQPFRSSLSVGCLRRIDPGCSRADDYDDDDDNEEEKKQEEDNKSDDNGGRGGTTTQRYAASKRPIRSEFSRSLPRLGKWLLVAHSVN